VSQRAVKENDAVMFDIDDTLIRVDGSPIEEMIVLFKLCKLLGYKCIIITARPDYEENKRETISQLLTFGISPYEIYYAPAELKTTVKQQTGYNYVLSVGDMNTDLFGSEYFIKLPDMFDRRVHSNIVL
jgi:ribonucleotide monophosphatase NagD (HAD superfamily)